MIHSWRLGLAGGILWGLCMFFTTIISMYTGYAALFLHMMESIYPGYSISWTGSFVGFIYGFFDVLIGLGLLGWLYNRFSGKYS